MRRIFLNYSPSMKHTWGPVINYIFNTYLDVNLPINLNAEYPETDLLDDKEFLNIKEKVAKSNFKYIGVLEDFPLLTVYVCFIGPYPFKISFDELYKSVLAGGFTNTSLINNLMKEQQHKLPYIDIASLFVVEDLFETEFCSDKEEVTELVKEFLSDNPNDEISITNTVTNLTVWINKNL